MSGGLFFVPGATSIATTPTPTYVRNPAWPTFTQPVSPEEKVIGLYAVWPGDGVGNGGNFFAVTISGAYTINYGDGTVTNYASGATAYYEFDYRNAALAGTNAPVTLTAATSTLSRTAHGLQNGDRITLFDLVGSTGILSNTLYYVINRSEDTFQLATTATGSAIAFSGDGTAALLPYKVAVVTITPQAGNNLTSVNLFVKHNQTGLINGYSTGWLDLAISVPNATSLNVSSSGPTLRHALLEKCVIVDHGSVTSFSYLFSSCYRLRYPVFIKSVSAVTNMSSMFNVCSSLQTIPPFPGSVAAVTNMSSMFSICRALQTIPPFPGSVAAVTNMSSMFSSCYSLQTIPPFPGSVAAVTNMSNMFNGCYALQTIPPFPGSVAAVTNMSSMFINCYLLQTIPPFPGSVAAVTDMSSMFSACSALQTIPPFPGSVASVTSMSNMFNSCYALQTIPPFPGSVAAVTNMSGMFINCYSLQTIPPFPGSVAAVTDITSMFNTCQSLQAIPPFPSSLTSLTTLSAVASSAPSLASGVFPGIKVSFSVASCKYSAPALVALFNGLASNVTGQTLTITGNYGVDTAVTKTTICSTTAGSTTVACTNTSNLATGMFVTGLGLAISTDVTVSSDVAADTLTKTAHGLTNGTPIAFTALGTTTGITAKTIYYVRDVTPDTFKIATTVGGAAINLTGSNEAAMTIRYAAYITGITTNTSYTLSLPAASTLSNQTHTFRALDSSVALLKGWSVTY